jgi:hypothetical protein
MSTGSFVIYALIDILTYLPLYFREYLEMKNINFKLYFKAIMQAYLIKED